MSQGKKKRTWSASDKMRIVLKGLEPGVDIAAMCRQEGLSPTQFYSWKKQLVSSASAVFGNKRKQRVDGREERMKSVVAEITQINSGWATPQYNRAGNMTRIPLPISPGSNVAATYDAWNRLVKIEQGGGFVVTYQYDGAKRRIVESRRISLVEDTRHLYYTQPSRWQVIEERIDGSDDAQQQFVWGLRYIDELLLRDRDTTGSGTLDEHLVALQDANWNVTALADDTGVQQRFSYNAYGEVTRLTPGWTHMTDDYFWNLLFAGYRYETTTGLYHVRNRVYNTKLGCWVQRDPLKFSGDLNIFRYSRSRPLSFTDGTGLKGYSGCVFKNARAHGYNIRNDGEAVTIDPSHLACFYKCYCEDGTEIEELMDVPLRPDILLSSINSETICTAANLIHTLLDDNKNACFGRRVRVRVPKPCPVKKPLRVACSIPHPTPNGIIYLFTAAIAITSAVIISQLDSPLPGPADAVAVGILIAAGLIPDVEGQKCEFS